MSTTTRIGHLSVEHDDRVLRPRPWTAEQARWAADLDGQVPAGPILELCAGVGHIGLLLASLVGRSVVLVDADPAACGCARRNAEAAGVDAEVRRAPVTSAVADDERFPIVLADPPWVPSAEVGRYAGDPVAAIDGGPDGLDVARICVEVMRRHIRPGGVAILQLGTLAQAGTLADELSRQRARSKQRGSGPKGRGSGPGPTALEVAEVRDIADANGVLVRLALG